MGARSTGEGGGLRDPSGNHNATINLNLNKFTNVNEAERFCAKRLVLVSVSDCLLYQCYKIKDTKSARLQVNLN